MKILTQIQGESMMFFFLLSINLFDLISWQHMCISTETLFVTDEVTIYENLNPNPWREHDVVVFLLRINLFDLISWQHLCISTETLFVTDEVTIYENLYPNPRR